MVISSFYLICEGQKKYTPLQRDQIRNQEIIYKNLRYDLRFSFFLQMSLIKGICYLYNHEDEKGFYYEGDSYFDIGERQNTGKKDEVWPIVPNEELRQEVLDIIAYHLKSSPVHRVTVMVVLEHIKPYLHPVKQCSFSEFKEMYQNNSLRFQTIYRISEDII